MKAPCRAAVVTQWMLCWGLATTAALTNMRVITYNLRYDALPDNLTVQDSLNALPDPLIEPRYLATHNEQPWSTRRIRVAENALSFGIDLACFQEALVRQVDDLLELFGSGWAWVGVGRDDGVAAGEFSPVFYSKTAFKLLETDTFWLSNEPFQPSKYPGAGSFRICTAARFSVIASGEEFSVLNTHLDDQSNDQRRLAASMLLTRARYEAVNTPGPVFVIGDFNSPPTGQDSSAYNIITGSIPPVPINQTFANRYAVAPGQFPNFNMVDLRGATPRRNISANYATFTDFSAPSDTSNWERIDFILGGSNMGWYASQYFVGTSLSDDGILASDHRPVFADISF
ncbi:hypothetical protein AX15_001690 [Amanita polypyramis BW_CC]|nr:hypothetical protein AX15_001690 [Amanita polypyramis BW_CC]